MQLYNFFKDYKNSYAINPCIAQITRNPGKQFNISTEFQTIYNIPKGHNQKKQIKELCNKTRNNKILRNQN